MAKVLGIGGVFVKAQDPKALGDWYQRVLGFPMNDWGGAIFPHPAEGMTLWSAFKADSDHFAPSTRDFMINLVVDDLDGVLERARTEGVEPIGRQEDTYGRFAWILDPAGVKLELWQAGDGAET